MDNETKRKLRNLIEEYSQKNLVATDLNVKTFTGFKGILANLINEFGEDDGVDVYASMNRTIDPLSDWITVRGKCITFNNLSDLKEHLSSISNIEILLDAKDNVVINMAFNDMFVIDEEVSE